MNSDERSWMIQPNIDMATEPRDSKIRELRELLRDCPLLHTTTCNVAERSWIERAREEALKL